MYNCLSMSTMELPLSAFLITTSCREGSVLRLCLSSGVRLSGSLVLRYVLESLVNWGKELVTSTN